MRLVLDQGLPRSSARLLRGMGMDAVHVGELQMSEAEDEEILGYALQHDLWIVTLDADFNTLVALTGAAKPSVIRLRLQRLRAAEAANLIQSVVKESIEVLQQGCFVTVTSTAIRIRKLPVRAGRLSE